MIHNFERLVGNVNSIYGNIQKIKKFEMQNFELKGKHVMPMYYLYTSEKPLTSADLVEMCGADKAGISRALADIEAMGYINFEEKGEKRYRSEITMTHEGEQIASRMIDIILNATVAGGENITDEERVIFYKVLATIRENLDCVVAALGVENVSEE